CHQLPVSLADGLLPRCSPTEDARGWRLVLQQERQDTHAIKGMWRGDAGRSYVEKIENRWQYVKRHRRHGCHGSTFNLSRPACDCWDAVSSLVKLPLLPAEWPVRTHFRPNSLIIMQIAAIVGSKKYERLLVDTLFFQRFQNAAHAL